jgi:hypothetical protein
MADKKKYYRLGDKATLFVDPVSGFKIAMGQVLEPTELQMKSTEFLKAKKGGHIVILDAEETEEWESSDEFATLNKAKEEATKTTSGVRRAKAPAAELTADQQVELDRFSALKNEDMIAFIEDEYEIEAEELKAIKMMKKDDLIAKYKTLLIEVG